MLICSEERVTEKNRLETIFPFWPGDEFSTLWLDLEKLFYLVVLTVFKRPLNRAEDFEHNKTQKDNLIQTETNRMIPIHDSVNKTRHAWNLKITW